MTKWFNQKVNNFFQTKLTERETDLIALGGFTTGATAIIFVLFNAIFPNC